MKEKETCTHHCESCSADCGSRLPAKEVPNAGSHVKKVYGVISGKGGVGKSLVTSMLAVCLQRAGKKVGILDADITGPSIPHIFGIHQHAVAVEEGILPCYSKGGIPVVSTNLMLQNETDPVVWRGGMIAGAVKQFWTDVVWGNLDALFLDMPPGTGDVALTVFQSLPVDGILIVTSPQGLVSMIVEKAVKMAQMMNVPIVGLVENMSYAVCPHCGEPFYPYGESHIEEVAAQYHLPVLAKLPIHPDLAKLCDEGRFEEFEQEEIDGAVQALLRRE